MQSPTEYMKSILHEDFPELTRDQLEGVLADLHTSNLDPALLDVVGEMVHFLLAVDAEA